MRSPPVCPPGDGWRTFKGTEHEDDAPVLLQMRHRLDAAAHQVQVGHRARIEDAERVEPFGREIEMSIQPRRGGGHEEHMLRPDERGVALVNACVHLTHDMLLSGCPRLIAPAL